MKTNKIYVVCSLLAFMVLAFGACQPDEYALGEMISENQLEYSITQNPDDPNMIFLESLTPGVTPLWITPMGRSTQLKDTLFIPFSGNYSFIYGVQSDGGFVQADTFKVTITTNNLMYVEDPLWEKLTGGVGNEKTWLLDLDENGVSKYFTSPLYFFGTDDNWDSNALYRDGKNSDFIKDLLGLEDSWNWSPSWKGNEWIMQAGDYGSMTFSLKGNAIVTVDNKMLGRVEIGTFFLDAEAKRLSMTDATPVHNPEHDPLVSSWGDVKVMLLTEDALQLGVIRDLSEEGEALLVYNYISKEYAQNWVPADEQEPEPPYDGDANIDLTTTTTKQWRLSLTNPYNWTSLDGTFLNDFTSPEDYQNSGWAPYDAALIENITLKMSKIDATSGDYEFTDGEGNQIAGAYEIDEDNNIVFDQSISFSLSGWVTFATTENNRLRVLRVEKNSIGAVTGIWIGQRSTEKDEYMAYHFEPYAEGGETVDPTTVITEMLCAKTWKIDSQRSYNKSTSWGAEQGPVIFSDYSTWSWNPLPGEHYAAGEAEVDYGTMKFETDGTVKVFQRKRIYTYTDETTETTAVREGIPVEGDVLETDETVELSGTWSLDGEANTITLSVGILHPWTCDYAVADWGAIDIYRIEEDALLLQVTRSAELSGEDEMPITYIYVPE
ncbi:hypothetical protein ACT29H_15890 [Thermophagus sp. OGC60D27]|uniref:hypothetical protein n=1 Tax=Thermophagus sp. OGC60D27 TaxID=3458415 RepID=UPI004037F4E6